MTLETTPRVVIKFMRDESQFKMEVAARRKFEQGLSKSSSSVLNPEASSAGNAGLRVGSDDSGKYVFNVLKTYGPEDEDYEQFRTQAKVCAIDSLAF